MRRRNFWAAVSLVVGILASGVFTSLAAPLVAATDPNAYFDELVKRRDFWKGYSLRPKPGAPIESPHYEYQLEQPLDGGYANSNTAPLAVIYSPGTDKDPHAQDAAKVVVPAFTSSRALTMPIAASTSGTQHTIELPWAGDFDNGHGIKIDDEIMTVYRRSGSPRSTTVLVTRGQYGTTAAAHRVGAMVEVSTNSLMNQIRLPLGTTDGHVYLFTWDGYWTDSYMGGLGSFEHKAFQFTSLRDNIWLEVQTRFDGGRRDSQPRGGVARPPDWNPAIHVAGVEMRSYQRANGPANWAASNGDVMGPGTTLQIPINPKVGAFAMKPNTWTRFWVRIHQRANDYDLMDFWVADEDREVVQIYHQIPMSVRSSGQIEKFWLEFNSSNTAYVRGNLRDLTSYVRNFVALRDPGDVTRLLQRPIAEPSRAAGAGSSSTPSAPRNLRIIR
jgi:hypothetical protein